MDLGGPNSTVRLFVLQAYIRSTVRSMVRTSGIGETYMTMRLVGPLFKCFQG